VIKSRAAAGRKPLGWPRPIAGRPAARLPGHRGSDDLSTHRPSV